LIPSSEAEADAMAAISTAKYATMQMVEGLMGVLRALADVVDVREWVEDRIEALEDVCNYTDIETLDVLERIEETEGDLDLLKAQALPHAGVHFVSMYVLNTLAEESGVRPRAPLSLRDSLRD